MLCCFCAILLNNLMILVIETQNYKKNKTTGLFILAKIISDNSTAAIKFLDQDAAKELLQTVSADTSIHHAVLYNSACLKFAEYGVKASDGKEQPTIKIDCHNYKNHFYTDHYLHLSTPIILEGQQIGTLMIKSSLDGLKQKFNQQIQIVLILLLVSLLIAFLLSLKLQRFLFEPIKKLLSAIRHITQHRDYSIQVHAHTDDELALLANEFNSMIEKINQRDKQLNNYNQLLEQTVEQRTHELQINLQHLKQAKDTAENADRAKSEFLAHISHDLRTPLNGLLGYVQILQLKKEFPAKFLNEINIIEQSGLYLLSIINDLLDLTKIESNKLELSLQTFITTDFLSPIVDLFNNQAKKKNFEFIYDIDGALPKALYGDENRLRRILCNLLENAFKFTVQGQVKFTVSYSNKTLFFSIVDSGCGINKKNLEAIFEPFNQFARFTNNDGVGLGLYITKYLVHLMKGSLSINSQINEGTQCMLSLLIPTNSVIPSESDKYEAVIGYQGNLITVVVVDDKQHNLDVLEAMLKPFGFKVICVNSGFACLQCLQTVQADIVLLDMVMPELNGIDTCKRICQQKFTKQAKIIMITANAFEEDRENCLAAGCNDFIAKPVLMNQLLDIFQIQLNIQWLYQDNRETNIQNAFSAKPLRVLIADDNEICRLLMKHFLDEFGAESLFAEDGEKAYNLIQDMPFDCIILDIKMPHKSGIEIANYIVQNETPNNQCYLVAMSAFTNNEITTEALKAGFNVILTKPVDLDNLSKLLKRVQNNARNMHSFQS